MIQGEYILKRELEEKLYHRFQWLTSINNIWCDDGWFQLIYKLCEEIENIYNKRNLDINTIRVGDIKEKYGALQFDLGKCIEEAYEIVQKYEELSESICQSAELMVDCT